MICWNLIQISIFSVIAVRVIADSDILQEFIKPEKQEVSFYHLFTWILCLSKFTFNMRLPDKILLPSTSMLLNLL